MHIYTYNIYSVKYTYYLQSANMFYKEDIFDSYEHEQKLLSFTMLFNRVC